MAARDIVLQYVGLDGKAILTHGRWDKVEAAHYRRILQISVVQAVRSKQHNLPLRTRLSSGTQSVKKRQVP
jgi:hypothetical protein